MTGDTYTVSAYFGLDLKTIVYRITLPILMNLFTCSAALGSLSRIACAALLFLKVMAAANGVSPLRSLTARSSIGCAISILMIVGCWLVMAIWIGALPSASCGHQKQQIFDEILEEIITPMKTV